MKKIKMLKSTPGSNDGKYVTKFTAGVIYKCPEQISENLAEVFIQIKVAEEYVDPAAAARKSDLEKKFRKKTDPPNTQDDAPPNPEVGDDEEESDEEESDEEESDEKTFTEDMLKGMSATEIRNLAKGTHIDLGEFAMNTSAEKLKKAFLERQ